MRAELLEHGRADAGDRVEVFEFAEDRLAGLQGELLLAVLDDAVGQRLADARQEAQLGRGGGVGIECASDLVGELASGWEVIGDRAGGRPRPPQNHRRQGQ